MDLERVGVVLIGRNEGARLGAALDAVPDTVGALVYVDSGSSDDSVHLAAAAGAKVVELDASAGFTAARGRNAGARALRANHPGLEFIQFIDGDCLLVDAWLEAGMTRLDAAPAVAAVCGARREQFPDASIYNTVCDVEWNQASPGVVDAFAGDVLIRMETFFAVGGYNAAVVAAEDDELSIRVRAAGWSIERLDHDMALHDVAMTSARQWWKRAERAGYGYLLVNRIHGGPPEHYFAPQLRRAVLWVRSCPLECCLWPSGPGRSQQRPPSCMSFGWDASPARHIVVAGDRGSPLRGAHPVSPVPFRRWWGSSASWRIASETAGPRSSSTSDTDMTPSATRPTTPVRVGILGAGYIAEAHVAALGRLPGVELVAVCDRALPRAASLADASGALAFDDLFDMVREADLDVVHNLTPPDAHEATTVQLLEAGVDVLVEKPFATSRSGAQSLTDLASSLGRHLGVSHSSMYAEAHRRLVDDVAEGRLGRIDHVHAVWRTDFGQLHSGDTDGWMFRAAGNIVAEIGPHPLSHVIDLLGRPDHLTTTAERALTLPGGVDFHRRWHVHGTAGDASFTIDLEFEPGYGQEVLTVRGSTASATVDLVRNTYVRHRVRPGQFDVERLTSTAAESAETVRDGVRTLARVVATKAGRSQFSNPFHDSVATAVASFHEARQRGLVEGGVSAGFGLEVMDAVERIVESASVDSCVTGSQASMVDAEATLGPADALIIGGTGFIGRHLVAALRDAGQVVRIVGRSLSKLERLGDDELQLVVGSIADPATRTRAMTDVDTVYHLAMGDGSTWADWQASEVAPAIDVATSCLDLGVDRLVYASTIAVFDTASADPITNETWPDVAVLERNLYARAKAEVETELLRMHREDGLAVVIARPGIVLGPGGPVRHGGLASWAGESGCQIVGDGESALPLVLVSDVARALVQCGTVDAAVGGAFNLVGDVRLTANAYLDAVEAATEIRFDRSYRPIPWMYASEIGKWLVKVAVRHHNRTPPSYRHAAGATFRRPFSTETTKRVLHWTPEADVDAFIKQAIGGRADAVR